MTRAHFGLTAPSTTTTIPMQSIRIFTIAKIGNGVVWVTHHMDEASVNVEKAYYSTFRGTTTVMLLPARTDTKWFHNYINRRAEIRFVRGRLKFGGSKNSAPFPSMVCVFRPIGITEVGNETRKERIE